MKQVTEYIKYDTIKIKNISPLIHAKFIYDSGNDNWRNDRLLNIERIIYLLLIEIYE